ncbi:2OG-Fe dioxygenase family protein [Luteimonas sp. 50]|uniref:2OG-Fe dioxygenase family protein n=1 Tax=Cognatiluteimonas sedimenti TaxID=2927791 RepID=A0ABT0A6U5_9GAMM|nr:2OG-Fe dioxygenase family protein [Lysobacter sedimenti]MCJ0826708.1 2OG-Fe dioxygenase family protein [Lysobacter sedimenti]
MDPSFPPPFTPPAALLSQLRGHGYAVLAPEAVAALCAVDLGGLQALAPSWDDLPPDEYLRDGGRYRHRRHACYVLADGAVAPVPHRAHWQPVEYNALHGGMHRWFEPVAPATAAEPAWERLLVALGALFSQLRDTPRWHVEAHQFRIDTADGIGRPTPEGAHRDGVDFVAVFLVARDGIKGGETRVFEADGAAGLRFTLARPWSLLLLDDARVIHESTPIQPQDPAAPGHRDTLVLTYRASGFQGEA